MTLRTQEEEYIEQIGFKKEDATDRTKWRNAMNVAQCYNMNFLQT